LEFPGTVIHELAHLFTAEILRVRTGKLTLVPESIREANIKSGSVAVAETDPFRRYAIGLAPIFAGIIVLTALSYFLPVFLDSVFYSGIPFWQNADTYWLLLIGYGMFATSNSMFSSPEDVKGFLPFAFVIGVFVFLGYMLGIRFSLTGELLEITMRTMTTLSNSLLVVIALNVSLLILSWGLTWSLLRMLRLRLQN
jgi:hypothetical protein